MLNKITSWTGDFFLVYVDGGMLKSRTSMIPYFLKRNIVGDIKSSNLIVRILYFSVIHHIGILPRFHFFFIYNASKHGT